MCVGSLMIWLNPNCDVICSILLPSKLVWSFAHQFVDFTLKSLIATRRKGLFCARLSKVLSKFSQKLSKTSWDWHGDLYRTIKWHVYPQSLFDLRCRYRFTIFVVTYLDVTLENWYSLSTVSEKIWISSPLSVELKESSFKGKQIFHDMIIFYF